MSLTIGINIEKKRFSCYLSIVKMVTVTSGLLYKTKRIRIREEHDDIWQF